jgi:hypothetical protein
MPIETLYFIRVDIGVQVEVDSLYYPESGKTTYKAFVTKGVDNLIIPDVHWLNLDSLITYLTSRGYEQVTSPANLDEGHATVYDIFVSFMQPLESSVHMLVPKYFTRAQIYTGAEQRGQTMRRLVHLRLVEYRRMEETIEDFARTLMNAHNEVTVEYLRQEMWCSGVWGVMSCPRGSLQKS